MDGAWWADQIGGTIMWRDYRRCVAELRIWTFSTGVGVGTTRISSRLARQFHKCFGRTIMSSCAGVLRSVEAIASEGTVRNIGIMIGTNLSRRAWHAVAAVGGSQNVAPSSCVCERVGSTVRRTSVDAELILGTQVGGHSWQLGAGWAEIPVVTNIRDICLSSAETVEGLVALCAVVDRNLANFLVVCTFRTRERGVICSESRTVKALRTV